MGIVRFRYACLPLNMCLLYACVRACVFILCFVQAGRAGDEKFRAIGTAVTVSRVIASSVPESCFSVFVTGYCRFRVRRVLPGKHQLVAEVKQLDRFPGQSKHTWHDIWCSY